MYKTGIITDEISQDLTVAAALAQKYGLHALEIRSVNERNPFQMEKSDFTHVKQVADAFGMKICAISSPLFKCELQNEAEYHQHLEGLKRCVEAAHLWGTSLIRSFTFWYKEGGAACFEAVAEKYQKAIDIAKDAGITLVIESEPSVNTRNIGLLVQFLQLLGTPYVGALWDPGNEISDPTAPPPFPNGYSILKPYIKHVHLKDIKGKPTGTFYEPALLGKGDVDFHGVLKQLKQDGYNGYVSVETHYRMKTAQLDEGLLVRPQGSSFSEGGYQASIAYLDLLRDEYDWMGEVR